MKLTCDSLQIGGFAVVHEFYRWGPTSSLKVAVDAALRLYENVIPEKADKTIPLHELNAPMESLVECKRVWDNVFLFCKTGTDTSVIKMKEIKRRLTWLEQQIERQKLRDSVASPKAPEIISLSKSAEGKRSLEDPEVPPTKRQRLDPADESVHDSAEIMRSLRFDPKLSPCLNWVDMAMIDTSNVSPLTHPPALPNAKDLVELATGETLTDLIIDPYMALLCHYGNGHFKSSQVDFEIPGSPKWHAWSTWFAHQIGPGKMFKGLWPPKAYPGAKIGDVMHHVIPIFLDGNHWGMAILSNTDGTRRLDFYSSLPGYEKQFEEIWLRVASWLMNEAKSDLGLQNLPFNVPQQPRQTNVVDCGVFICCELRWFIEAWPLHTLLPENIPKLRRRMVVELEKWSLSV